MATKLTIKSETNDRDLLDTATSEYSVEMTGYTEGMSDNITWRFEQFCKFLLADGYSMELINTFIKYDGEVYQLEEDEQLK